MANNWQEELKNETYTVGAPETLGKTEWGWDKHYEVHFANGAIALIDCYRDQIQFPCEIQVNQQAINCAQRA